MREEETNARIREDISLLAENVASLWRELHAKGRTELEHARNEALGTIASARNMAARKARDLDAYAHEKPWMVVGVAAAAGAMLSAIVMLRKRRHRYR